MSEVILLPRNLAKLVGRCKMTLPHMQEAHNGCKVRVLAAGQTLGRGILKVVTTDDFMTADFARLLWDLLARVSARINNEAPGVTRVVYNISGKSPATIEWE